MTGRQSRLSRGTGWFAFCLVTSAVVSFAGTTNLLPVIFPNGEGTNTSEYRLVWSTDPGVRYQPQQSPDLAGWTTLDGYPKLGPGLADEYLFNANSNRQFFRVLQLDEQPPVIAARYPDSGDFAVPRRARLTVNLADQSAIDPASLRLTVGSLGEFTTSSPQITFTNNTLFFDASMIGLGAYGEKVDMSLVAEDMLGNRATNSWSFELEVEFQVATNLFVFGSVQAQKSGQRIGNIPTAILASRSGWAATMDAGAQPWTLVSVVADRLVVAYTGSSAPAITVGAYLSNLTPANPNEIFYRKVTSINDDSLNKRLTVFTMDVTLDNLVQQGSLSVSPESLVLNVGEGGVFAKAALFEGTVTIPSIGYSLDGTEFKLKNTNDFEIIKLTAKKLHWWLTPKLSVAMDLSSGELKRFEAVASGKIDSAMVFNLDVLMLGLRQEYLLYALPEALKPQTWIYIGNIGPVPVFASLAFDMQIKATPEAKAFLHFEYGHRQESDMAFGLHCENSQVDWIKTFNSAPADIVPLTADIKGELSLKLSLKPKLEFLVFGLAGVSAGITPSGKIAITASTGDPPLKGILEAAVSLDLGLAGPALKNLDPKPELSEVLWVDQWLLFPKDAIAIQTPPTSQVVRAGDSAYFICSATAAKTISYQWYQRGVPLPGQTSRTLLLPYVTASHAGDYYVSLKAGSQKTNSTIATLTVMSPPVALSATEVTTNSFTARWQPVTGAQGYQIDVGTNIGFGNCIVRNALIGNTTSYPVEGLQKNTEYYCRVRAYAGSIVSPNSSPISVTTSNATENPVPIEGMALIPAGSFTMGDTLGDGDWDELPLHAVYVSAFYLDRTEVTKALWDEVRTWAVAHSYNFDYGAWGKAASHPAHSMTWYDAVKWCNARSEKEGLVPAYYTSAAQTTVYRTGKVDVQNDWVKWNSGYRLPTEAEWEKAARGGAGGHRFPWSNVNTITHSQANYYSSFTYSYDISPTFSYHPSYRVEPGAYTSPVGSFAPNEYGLYDMAGNVREWCWDWYGDYPSGSQADPRGPASGVERVYRDGSWVDGAERCRVASRTFGGLNLGNYYGGFRSALPADQ